MSLKTRFDHLIKRNRYSDLKSNGIKNNKQHISALRVNQPFDPGCRERAFNKQINTLESQMLEQTKFFHDGQQVILIGSNEIRGCKRNILELQENLEILKHSTALRIKGTLPTYLAYRKGYRNSMFTIYLDRKYIYFLAVTCQLFVLK